MSSFSKKQAKEIHSGFDKSGRVIHGRNHSNEESELSFESKKLLQDGYIILENVLSNEEIDAVRSSVRGLLVGEKGRNNFEGRLTERIYGLPTKTRATDILIEHPRIVKILDELLEPNYLLSAMQAINIHPGESSQPLHTDDLFVHVPRPRKHFGIATIWALSDFKESNGATVVAPRSHLWGDSIVEEAVKPENLVPVVMPAGSVVVFLSTLWHGGGASDPKSEAVREAITFQYCQPYLRPQENALLGLDPRDIPTLSERMKSLLGLSIHPPFIGHYDGLHPLKSPWVLKGKL